MLYVIDRWTFLIDNSSYVSKYVCVSLEVNKNLKPVFFIQCTQGSLTCNGADTIISYRGGNPGTNLRIGTGSTAVTFAGIDAWTWSASTLPENTSYLLLSLVKVSKISSNLFSLRIEGDAKKMHKKCVEGWI